MPKHVFQLLQQRFPDHVLEAYTYLGDAIVVVDKVAIRDVCKFLRDNPELKFTMLVDLAGVDYLGRDPRFEVVYQLYCFDTNRRIRVKVPID